MKNLEADRTEGLLRYMRRLQVVSLATISTGFCYLALTAWDPEAHFERLRSGLLVFCPVILTLGFVWSKLALKGNRYSLKDPVVQAINRDEFRRINLGRSARVAFFSVMIVQIPLAWVLSLRPSGQSPFHMGTLTTFIGFISMLAAFLFFERD